MAGYNRTEAYDLSLFEEQIVKQKIEPIRIKKENEPAQEKRKVENRKNRAYALKVRSALKAGVFAVVSLTCIALMLLSRAQSDELSRKITKLENDIKIAQSENVRLNTAMNSLISADKVETYAEEVLGMVRAENYQITYIDMSKGNMIVLSGDKTDLKEKLTVKLKELFAYPP
ncbi:MAG TPA: hypothetical protein PKN28_02995 [Clostridiales bacterium]|nr:hypothetical protein [Clostridiales bacterium]